MNGCSIKDNISNLLDFNPHCISVNSGQLCISSVLLEHAHSFHVKICFWPMFPRLMRCLTRVALSYNSWIPKACFCKQIVELRLKNVAFFSRKEHCPDFFLALGPAGLKNWVRSSTVGAISCQRAACCTLATLATSLSNMLSNVISRWILTNQPPSTQCSLIYH